MAIDQDPEMSGMTGRGLDDLCLREDSHKRQPQPEIQ